MSREGRGPWEAPPRGQGFEVGGHPPEWCYPLWGRDSAVKGHACEATPLNSRDPSQGMGRGMVEGRGSLLVRGQAGILTGERPLPEDLLKK